MIRCSIDGGGGESLDDSGAGPEVLSIPKVLFAICKLPLGTECLDVLMRLSSMRNSISTPAS